MSLGSGDRNQRTLSLSQRPDLLPCIYSLGSFPIVWLPQTRLEDSQDITMNEAWYQPSGSSWAMGETGYLHDYSCGKLGSQRRALSMPCAQSPYKQGMGHLS